MFPVGTDKADYILQQMRQLNTYHTNFGKSVTLITLHHREFRKYVCIFLLPDKTVKFLFPVLYISFLTNPE